MKLLTETVTSLSNATGTTEDFVLGFVSALFAVLTLLLLVALLLRLKRGGRRVKGISVPGEHGDLTVSLNAIHEFVKGILEEFDEASLKNLRLCEHGDVLTLYVDIDVQPDTVLPPLRDKIQGRILEDVRKTIGTEQPISIDLSVESMDAVVESKRKHAKNSNSQPDNSVKAGAFAEPVLEQVAPPPVSSDVDKVMEETPSEKNKGEQTEDVKKNDEKSAKTEKTASSEVQDEKVGNKDKDRGEGASTMTTFKFGVKGTEKPEDEKKRDAKNDLKGNKTTSDEEEKSKQNSDEHSNKKSSSEKGQFGL
jgi:hypothetical protein